MVEVQGVESTAKSMKALSKRYTVNIAKAIVKSAHLVRGEAIKDIQDPSQGETVTKSRGDGNTYEHTQGAKGEAPNTDTGRLVASLQVEVQPEGAYVGSGLEYAKFLEFGNHPYLVPALQRNRRQIIKLVSFAVKETKK